MRWALPLLLLAGCVTTPAPVPVGPEPVKPEPAVPAADPQVAVRAVVQAFIAATEARKFDEVLALLAKPLRARYSVKTLERDFGADPLAAARLAELKHKSNGPLVEGKDSASLAWASGRSLRLVKEAEGWRIAALE